MIVYSSYACVGKVQVSTTRSALNLFPLVKYKDKNSIQSRSFINTASGQGNC